MGGRIGIEVTKLVAGDLIAAEKSRAAIPGEPFSESHSFGLLAERIAKKHNPEGCQRSALSQVRAYHLLR